jgi:glycosyltransferase involved in cell wall biosynthesis
MAITGKLCKGDSRFKVINLPRNSGAAIARNKGIELALGKYIAFLDADDLWLPQKLEKQVNLLENSSYNFTFSSYSLVDELGKPKGNFIIPKEEVTYKDLLKTCSIGCLTAMYNQESLGKLYMENLEKRQDYTLWLKILKKENAVGLTEVLAQYRISQNSLSANKFDAAMFQWLVYRKIEQLGFFKALYYFTHYAFRGFLKYK